MAEVSNVCKSLSGDFEIEWSVSANGYVTLEVNYPIAETSMCIMDSGLPVNAVRALGELRDAIDALIDNVDLESDREASRLAIEMIKGTRKSLNGMTIRADDPDLSVKGGA